MHILSYFGYGSNRDHDMMAAIIGRDNLSGIRGIIFNYELVIQNIEHIPDKILSTAPVAHSPRGIMKRSLGDKAKLYIIRPRHGAITYGTIWQITPEEYEMVRNWELLDFGMQEDMQVVAQTETGKKIMVQTHGSNDPCLQMSKVIEGEGYQDYIVPKEKIFRTARRVNYEFQKSIAIKLKPLDPEKVKRVVEKFSARHVRHKHGEIIFVGSGGGKSTTCRNQIPDAEGKTDLVDADLVYRETEAHPLRPGINPPLPLPWWNMGKKVIQEVEKRCGVVNESMIKHGLWALTTSFDPDDKYIPKNIVIVILPWKEHKKRIIQKSRGKHYDAGAKATDEGFALVKRHRKWAERVAKEKNIPVVDSIETAIYLIRSREE